MESRTEKWKKLIEDILGKQNLKDKNLQYLHGIMYGIDFPQQHDLMVVSIDETTYHAIVLDERLRGTTSLKDTLTGKDISHVVERFETSDPDEAYKFFYKYNNVEENENKQEDKTKDDREEIKEVV